jgi:hypothetical protein
MLAEAASLAAANAIENDLGEIGRQIVGSVISTLAAKRAVILVEGPDGLERLADADGSGGIVSRMDRSASISARELPLPLLRQALEAQACATYDASLDSDRLLGSYAPSEGVGQVRCETLEHDGIIVGALYVELPFGTQDVAAVQGFVQLVVHQAAGALARLAGSTVKPSSDLDSAPTTGQIDSRKRTRLIELVSSILIEANAGGGGGGGVLTPPPRRRGGLPR